MPARVLPCTPPQGTCQGESRSCANSLGYAPASQAPHSRLGSDQLPSCKGGVPEGRGGLFSPGLPAVQIPAKMPLDLNQDSLGVPEHHLVFKTQHLNTQHAQERITLKIIFLGADEIVHLSIQLNGQPFLRTVKIENVPGHTVLSSELPAFEMCAFEMCPQFRFCWRQVFA